MVNYTCELGFLCICAHKASCAASLYPHRHIQRDELNVQYNTFLLMAGCGVLEVGHNLFSYNMKINCIAAHTYNQIPNILCKMEMAPQTTKLPRL